MNTLIAHKAPISIEEQDNYINILLPQIAEYISSVPISILKISDADWVNEITVGWIIIRMVKEGLICFTEGDKTRVEMDVKGYECIKQGGYLQQKANLAIERNQAKTTANITLV